MTLIEIQIVLAIVALGFVFFVNQAWNGRGNPNRLKSFFLADARLGAEKTENNTLGNTFAWSGGTWFYVFCSFTFGPLILLVQPVWCISLIILSLLFTRIHSVTRNKTLHGFLGISYGGKVRITASIATTFGYIFNTGFEMYWSSLLFAFVLGKPELALPIALLKAIIIAIYCNIGGFGSNASTDKPQNLLGVIALVTLSSFVVFRTSSTPLIVSNILFAVGGIIYVALSLFRTKKYSILRDKIHSGFAIILAICAVGISIFLSTPSGGSNLYTGLLPFPTSLIIGLVVFMSIFNLVDMANWQSIAANGDIEKTKHKPLRWAIIRSGLYVNWFPSLGGILIGLALRLLYTGIDDTNIFKFAFDSVLPEGDPIVRGFIIGGLLLGFLATSLSASDSYLMSAVQTIIYDLWYHDEIIELLDNENEAKESFYVRRAKAILLPVAILMVLVFYGAYKGYTRLVDRSALDFQMLIYSFAITLLVPVMYALFFGADKARVQSRTAFWAIVVGITTAILPYIIAVSFSKDADLIGDIVNYTPIYSLSTSTIIFLTGLIFNNKKHL